MKTSIKFSLLGVLVGVVVMVVVGLVIVFMPRPSLDKQVIKQVEECGYHVDTLPNHRYRFWAYDDKMFFDYFPNDNAYLCFYGGYIYTGHTMEEVAAACVEVMQKKKNTIIYPQIEDEEGVYVRVEVTSFVDEDVMIDKEIVERSIDVLASAAGMLYRELLHSEGSD